MVLRQAPGNPPENVLSKGVEDECLVAAIEKSGYPLQGRVALKLKDEFHVTEEWGYFDNVINEHRSLDIFAYQQLAPDHGVKNVRPSCATLIECKRSDLPYVFFRRMADHSIPNYPPVAGMYGDGLLQLWQTGTSAHAYIPPNVVLGMKSTPFVESGPVLCAAFSKVDVSQKKMTLSGASPYKSVVLPLVRACDHLHHLYRPSSLPGVVFPTLVQMVGVLDAPMVLVESPERMSNPVMTPWVRIIRHESILGREKRKKIPTNYVIEMVHIEFFDQFIKDHLSPFIQIYFDRVSNSGELFVLGGEVTNLSSWQWNDVKSRRKKV